MRKKPSFRTFSSGASRNLDEGKLDFEGFMSPLVVTRFAEYMHEHRKMPDGSLRSGDNWQKGIPQDELIKSGLRHVMDWWMAHRGCESREGMEKALCGILFNVNGYLLAELQKRGYKEKGAPHGKSRTA